MAKTFSKIILPAKGLEGEIKVPGDKSISHRAVILGSIADGKTEVTNFLPGEDNLRTVGALSKMGAAIERPSPSTVIINGAGMRGLKEPDDFIDCGNSGTTARLLTGLLSAQSFFSALTGDSSLRKRPMKRVVVPLTRMGAKITGRVSGEYLPLAITGGKLKGIIYSTPVPSAQLKSSLLLAGLYAEGETTIKEPQKSRDHTERMLKKFGAKVTSDGNKASIKKTRALKACNIDVPGDISSAAFFIVGALITADSELLIKDVGVNPTRCGIIDILKKMRADIEILNFKEGEEPKADLLVRSSRLKGVDIGGKELLPAIDEFPVLCVAAAFAEGVTNISGAGELRVKESDRISVMAEELTKIGVLVREKKDGIVIEGRGKKIKGGKVTSHGDHRVAMAMAAAGLASDGGIEIEGADCVDVSFPGFFKELERVKKD